MKRECITIGKKGAVLHAYLHEQSENWRDYDKRPAMLICPGGGYEFVSDREMDPVALIGFSAGEYAHEGSFEKLTGRNRDDSWDEYSLEKYVDTDTPPCFLWHTVSDTCVPVENTLLLVKELQKKGISYECHLYPNGEHGLSICNKQVCGAESDNHVASWFTLCCECLGQLFCFNK